MASALCSQCQLSPFPAPPFHSQRSEAKEAWLVRLEAKQLCAAWVPRRRWGGEWDRGRMGGGEQRISQEYPKRSKEISLSSSLSLPPSNSFTVGYFS